ncbi:tRNA (guanosine(46)-N7)-methyltransferase TrmB [Larkinella soli]|uniref:tRNA (guanosine(46)-N7)-methyltransferase TrmB n=1 Tax=Larkinella soli TaxID=1770527 RepID=UPI000FFB56E9|nr:tRNA (guanosine(46)-N7)-methyltransferase TrmB [Larkinella soli]
MGRKKLERFEFIRESPIVLEPEKEIYRTIKGNWRKEFFKNNHPIVVELACGKGEYTIGLGRRFPDLNFIGVDRKGDRIGRGSQLAMEEGLSNVAFLRTDIHRIQEFFDEGEVNEIWITFPDPQPRIKQSKNRLTHPRYLELYRQILVKGGTLHLKTDNDDFFDFSLGHLPASGFQDVISTRDLYNSELNGVHLGIKTKFEEIFFKKGFSIKYLQCKKAV